jgi:signal transduction histidine kinase
VRKATSTERPAARLACADASANRLRAEAAHIARLALEGCAGAGCLVGWQRPADSGEARPPADAPHDALLDRLLAISQRTNLGRTADPAIGSEALSITILGPDDLMPLLYASRDGEEPNASAIAIGRTAEARAYVLLTAPVRGGPRSTLASIASLGLRAMLNRLEGENDRDTGDFWRDRATGNGAKLAELARAMKASAADAQTLEAKVTAAQRLRPANRFNGLGSIIAGHGPFVAWIVAVADKEEWRVAAALGVLAPSAPFKRESALAACCARQATIVRSNENMGVVAYAEDRLFARFAAYLCVPFDGGAVALASSGPIDQVAVERVERLIARLNPLIRTWMLDAETVRLRALVRNLALRMYGAAETERARIARDLHDHQAQRGVLFV